MPFAVFRPKRSSIGIMIKIMCGERAHKKIRKSRKNESETRHFFTEMGEKNSDNHNPHFFNSISQ
jgi:hypothetical protein